MSQVYRCQIYCLPMLDAAWYYSVYAIRRDEDRLDVLSQHRGETHVDRRYTPDYGRQPMGRAAELSKWIHNRFTDAETGEPVKPESVTLTEDDFKELKDAMEFLRIVARHGFPEICSVCDRYNPVMYMLHDYLWDQIKPDPNTRRGIVCFSCAQERLGRPITFADLKPCGLTTQMLLGVMIDRQSTFEQYIDALNTREPDTLEIRDLHEERINRDRTVS